MTDIETILIIIFIWVSITCHIICTVWVFEIKKHLSILSNETLIQQSLRRKRGMAMEEK